MEPLSPLGLSAEQFEQAFPFHFAFDSEGRLLQAGRVLRRICPALVVGEPIAPHLSVVRPRVPLDLAQVREKTSSLFIIRMDSPRATLRGQMLFDAQRQVMLFVGSPWLTRMEEATSLGLSLSDFAHHDPVREFLLLFKTKDLALAEAEALTDRLNAQSATLRELNHQLEARECQLRDSNEALSRAARLKDEFLSSMSHELRTPLTAILGMSESLLEGVYGAIDPRQSRAVSLVESSGRHLLELINDILDLSRIEAGRLELDIEAAEVSSVCQAAMAMVKPAATKKDLTLEVSIDPAVSNVEADQRRLKQILVNLLSNAVKFTPNGGAVTLRVSGHRDTGLVEFAVIDTGIGIAEPDLARLFIPFGQLDSGLARHHGGSGLGLVLTRKMTELHGGSVRVDSRVGLGSMFTVTLPWRPKSEATPASVNALPVESERSTQSSQPAAGSRPRVLVIDDNEINQAVLAGYLRARQFEVTTAASAMAGIAAARVVKPDVILMDVQMPDLDGLQATAMIRRDPDLSQTPIFALTGLAMKGDRERCLAAGVDEYMSKPVKLSDLLARIRARLDRVSEATA